MSLGWISIPHQHSYSSGCFYKLCEIGVPFPHNEYGEYIGYKTDHDPFERATSAGPLTSKYMTEKLEEEVWEKNVKIYDRTLAIKVIKIKDAVAGLIALNMDSGNYDIFKCDNIILATGGPAGIYYDSVYPESQNGFSSLAIEAGASLSNITEWQYGIASVKPRWNVSGTYMQVLPRFVSVDENDCEREFLKDYFEDEYEALSNVFLKGYQWPFDIKKVREGSSIIDLLVYREKILYNRRVYLDFTKNPFGLSEIEYDKLSKESYTYLKKSGVLFGKPIDRLLKMNEPAYMLYKNKGVDLNTEYLEIALCSQHCNGGIFVDNNWQTEIPGLYAIGECAGTHGITRPGGSALNSGQVGAKRAVLSIIKNKKREIDDIEFNEIALKLVKKETDFKESLKGKISVKDGIKKSRKDMSRYSGAIRDIESIKKLCTEITCNLNSISDTFYINTTGDLVRLYRLKDIYLTQLAMLYSIIGYYDKSKTSRGSALYTDKTGYLNKNLEEIFRFKYIEDRICSDLILRIKLNDTIWESNFKKVNPIPKTSENFETMWKNFRQKEAL